MQVSGWDLVIIIAYMAMIAAVGILSRKKVKDTKDYYDHDLKPLRKFCPVPNAYGHQSEKQSINNSPGSHSYGEQHSVFIQTEGDDGYQCKQSQSNRILLNIACILISFRHHDRHSGSGESAYKVHYLSGQ